MPVDKRIKQFVRQQVADGVYSTTEVKRHTESYVKRQLFHGKVLPSKLNRKFFPLGKDYANMIYRARIANMKSLVDQENLKLKIAEWTSDPGVKFFFRPFCDNDDSEMDDIDDSDSVILDSRGRRGLLLVHQTEWQRRLLRRYGSMCLLDATYKTTRYALPLFFLCVRTNVDYVVVATFVLQYEDKSSIAEALTILKSWNEEWSPASAMVDFSEAEINAVESVFPREYCGRLILQCYIKLRNTGSSELWRTVY